jgi:hypothetical protein
VLFRIKLIHKFRFFFVSEALWRKKAARLFASFYLSFFHKRMLPVSSSSSLDTRKRETALRRVSKATSLYSVPAVESAAHLSRPRRDGMPGRHFAAQLLELGLRYKVEGLVRKAEDALVFEPVSRVNAQGSAVAHYERAQNSFEDKAAAALLRHYI